MVCLILISFWVTPGLGEFVVSGDDEDNVGPELPTESRGGGRGITRYVGSDQTYKNIQDAVDASQSGDTVRVYAGSYSENVVVNKGISIIGNGTKNTTINGSYSGSVITIKSNWCNVSGFFITGSGSNFGVDAGIKLLGVENCSITYTNCSLNSVGMLLKYTNLTTIRYCTGRENSWDFINFTESHNNYIENCSSFWNDYGFDLTSSNYNIFDGNRIYYSNYGIRVQGSSNNKFFYNIFWNSFNRAMQLGYYPCNQNMIYYNNFIESEFIQATDSGNNIWNSTSEKKGNYWNDWTSPDSNSDGIVDNPYNIGGSSGAKDWHPLVNPTLFVGLPPVITTSNIEVAYVDEYYDVTYSATDPDTKLGRLTWKTTSNASWLNISAAENWLSGTPKTSDIGTYWVNVTVADYTNLAFTNFTLRVIDQRDNVVVIERTGQKFSKIQVAIDNAISGDTISVWEGRYNETIIIDKKLDLIGNGSSNTLIDTSQFSGSITVIKIEANDVTIKGFFLKGNGLARGIDISDNWGITICDIICNNFRLEGISIFNGGDIEIRNVTSNSNLEGLGIARSNNIRVTNSNICKNSDYGIFVSENNKITIQNSNISHNKIGIYNIESKDVTVKYNLLIDNYRENIRIFEGSVNNSIYLNNFYNKSGNFSVIDDDKNNSWNISSMGNFWSDWVSPDNNSDGIVDVPRTIPGKGGLKDHFPLTEPVKNNEFPPIIDTKNVLSAYVDILYSVNYSATDFDTPKKDLIWTMKTNASWLNFSQNQELFGTPKNYSIGTYWVNIFVTDGNNSDSTNFTITVFNASQIPPSNNTPKITTTNIQIAYVGKLYSVTYSATDYDTPQSQLSWYLNTNASWLTFTTTQTLSGTPSSSDVSKYWVNITVSDGAHIDSTNFTLAVLAKVPPPPTKGTVVIVRTGVRYNKIQMAIDNASADDTIRVWSGVYYENVRVNKKLSIIGNGSSNTTIDGRFIGSNFIVNADSCYISGFKIVNSTKDGIYYNWKYVGIHLKSYYNTITNCIFESHENHGINLEASDFNTIKDCTFSSNFIGINLFVSANNNITNCVFNSNSWSGINFSDVKYNVISNCTFSSNGNGIYVSGVEYNTIENNLFISNDYGILLWRSNNIYITNNNFNGNYIGIKIELGNSNTVVNNNFIADSNTEYQALDDGTNNNWNGSTKGNYWSDWLSPDKNKDGIVDLPYNISGNAGAKDHYPLTNATQPMDYPPTITTSNIYTAYVGQLYSVTYIATDFDTPIQQLSWFMNTNASWLNFSSSQRLYGTPSKPDIGTYWVYISVSDSKYSDSTNFTLTVLAKLPPKPNETTPKINRTSVLDKSTNVSVNTSEIVISFSKPMNISSVEAALSISPYVNYTLSWRKNNTELVIIFLEDLSYNTTYKITIGTNAMDSEDNDLKSLFDLEFTTEVEEGDKSPGHQNGDEPWDRVTIIGLVILIIIIIAFLVILSFLTRSKRKRLEQMVQKLERLEDDSGDIVVSNGIDEYIMELKKEALAPNKPSDFSLSRSEMLNRFKSKYEKGKISKETYESIRKSLLDQRKKP